MKKITIVATCLLLAGCADFQAAKPADVVFNSKQQKGLTGYHPMPVRAFSGSVSANSEMAGVPCDVIGSGFQARVITPAAVNVPVYGLRSKAIYVTCTHNQREKSETLPPINLTESKALANGASGGLLGVIVVGAVVAGRKNKDQDEYGYRGTNMVFKKEKNVE